MKVTVVIPTYNRAGYLEQAVNSALEQTLNDLEVIVVDDGSTDETADMMRSYRGKVRYVRTDNHGGPAHARNVGMRLAVGEYIAFLDSDDLYYPYKLEMQARVLDSQPGISMVCTECSAFDDSGILQRDYLKTYHRSAFRNTALTYDSIFQESVALRESGILPQGQSVDEGVEGRRVYFGNIFDTYLFNLVVFTNSMMFRRNLIQQVGYQNESLGFFEEFDYALRICRRCRVSFVDVPTYKMRLHPGQMSTTAKRDGTYVSVRKQQCLLRAVRRHAMQDEVYYRQRQPTIDAHLAKLYRAVAVPLLACERGDGRTRKGYTRRARKYLARCWAYGRPVPVLWCLSFLPSPGRRIGFAVMERMAALGHSLPGWRSFGTRWRNSGWQPIAPAGRV